VPLFALLFSRLCISLERSDRERGPDEGGLKKESGFHINL
jgi:hypothetical protein